VNALTLRRAIPGPAGDIECAIDEPASVAGGGSAARGMALVCHPHPLHGGTMDNKVVQTVARAAVQAGWRAVRFNFRGVGASAGSWDAGRGEVDDAQAVLQALRQPGEPLVIAGFSFGAHVAASLDARLGADDRALHRVLIGPAVQSFPLPAVPADTLVVHGEADEVVPLAAVMDWARPQVLPVVVVPATGHFFHGQLPLLKRLVHGALR